MAPDRKSDEILLNALVDGELAPAEQAAAAARLRTDKDFARGYATLSKLKAIVAENGDAAGLAAGELPLIEATRPPVPRRWVGYGAAACLALVFGAAALLVLRPVEVERQSQQVAAVSVVPVTFAGDPVIPDLSTAGLQLSRTVVSASTGVQSLVATYLGPRGCRLELWVSNAPAAIAGGTERRRWQVGELVYELVAFGMPASRFTKVAALAERETRATRPPEGMEPLLQARAAQPPCVT